MIFFVTLLDSSYSIVPGYSWLIHYNLSIDWVLRHITYYLTILQDSILIMFAARSASMIPVLNSTSLMTFNSLPLFISLNNAKVFLQAFKLPGSYSFHVYLFDLSTSVSTCKANLNEKPVNLSNISPKHYQFTNVSSKTQANNLASHHSYNLKINLKEGISLLQKPFFL